MTLDCRDMACPQPVIETKKALERLGVGEKLTLIVNTLSGRENCKRFAMSQSCAFTEEPMEAGATKLVITKAAAVMLSVGFYQMTIKKQIECDCEPSLTSKILKALFWVLFLFAFATLLYPWYEEFLWGE